MLSIGKRAASIGAVAAALALAGPVATAGAAQQAPGPAPITTPAGAYQAGLAAAIYGWNAGAAGAAFGFSAGAAALGYPFHFVVQPGPLGFGHVGIAPLP